MKTQFGQFDVNVRAAALKVLDARNVHPWQPGFDPNSEEIISLCQQIEDGKPPAASVSKTLYTWTEDMTQDFLRRIGAHTGAPWMGMN
jgi:hypothetical protein